MNSLTVLLVEDDANVREYVREVLETSGLTVVDVADATAALTVAASARLSIDLLLTDISMPGITGLSSPAASSSSDRRPESGTCPHRILTSSRRGASRSPGES